jgi:hypothetical protein
MRKIVCAIDPGGTTGIAIRLPTETDNLQTCVAKTPEELYDLINRGHITHIVIETFQAQLISRHGLDTVEIVGGVKALCHVLNIELETHMPQDRYPFQQEAKQLLQGKHTVIHEQDALAHLLRYEYDHPK